MPDRRRPGAGRAWVGLACAALVLTACSSAPPVAEEGYNGSQPSTPYAVPATQLRDTDGAAYSLTEQTTKPVTLVT